MIEKITTDESIPSEPPIIETSSRIPLVLWSGGLDSTYALFRELLKGDVDVLEVNFGHTFHNHREAERLARDKIFNELTTLHIAGMVKGKITARVKVNFEYPFDDNGSRVGWYGQQPAWLIAAYFNHSPFRHSVVISSMVCGDTIAISAPAMVDTWNALREISPAFSQKRYYDRSPITTLEFPLLYGCVNKGNVWRGDFFKDMFDERLDDQWKKIRELTWSCYKPYANAGPASTYIYEPCRNCDSCLTRAAYDKSHQRSTEEEPCAKQKLIQTAIDTVNSLEGALLALEEIDSVSEFIEEYIVKHRSPSFKNVELITTRIDNLHSALGIPGRSLDTGCFMSSSSRKMTTVIQLEALSEMNRNIFKAGRLAIERFKCSVLDTNPETQKSEGAENAITR